MKTLRPILFAALPALFVAAVVAGCDPPKQEGENAPPPPPAAPYGSAAATPVPAASPAAEKPSYSINSTGTEEVKGTTSVPAAASPGTAAPEAANAGGPMGNMAPFAAGGMGASPTSPLSPTPEMDKTIAEAEKSGDKKVIASAYAVRGTFRMNDDNAGARVKYRAALEDYRKALQADPTNAEAKKNKETIESIYRSMGRPIPGEEPGDAKNTATPPGKP